MYESFFQMNRRPFRAAPQAADYFPAASSERARQSVARCIQRAAGAALVIGPSGTGKTMLCLVLAEQFRDKLRVVHLTNGRYATPKALLQAILYELGRPYRRIEEGELRLALIDFVTSAERCPGGVLLLVDEAHALPPRQLEEIRMITNLVRDGVPRVRLVLTGGPELEERLAHPKLEALNQRLAARCYLEAFTREETHQYVRAVLADVAGDALAVFSDDALDAVYSATDGIPRFVNQVCDHALVLAYAGGQNVLDPGGIEEAWSDLQQLPTPWHETASVAEEDDREKCSIIEFGRLDDYAPETMPDVAVDSEPEFEPVSASGPEAEMSIEQDEPADPFGGEFDEEEVLIDRFAMLDTVAPPTSTPVSCPEGQELAARLQPHLVEEPGPQLRVAEREEREEPDPASDDADSFDDLPQEPRDSSTPAAAAGKVSLFDTPPEEDAIEPRTADVDSADDAGVLVIEDDPRPAARAAWEVSGARRENYGQLFARLRRG